MLWFWLIPAWKNTSIFRGLFLVFNSFFQGTRKIVLWANGFFLWTQSCHWNFRSKTRQRKNQKCHQSSPSLQKTQQILIITDDIKNCLLRTVQSLPFQFIQGKNVWNYFKLWHQSGKKTQQNEEEIAVWKTSNERGTAYLVFRITFGFSFAWGDLKIF